MLLGQLFSHFPSGNLARSPKYPSKSPDLGYSTKSPPRQFLPLKEFTAYWPAYLKNALRETLRDKKVVAATKNKHLKIVTSLGQGEENYPLFVYVLLFYLHETTALKRAVVMISILLVRKQTERGHNLLKITQQINGLDLELEWRPLVFFQFPCQYTNLPKQQLNFVLQRQREIV